MSYKRWGKLAVVTAAAVMLLATGCSKGKTDTPATAPKNVTIKLAHNLPTQHHLAVGMDEFAKKVQEKSKGSIQVKVFPSGQLFNDKSMNEAVMSGGVEMGLNSAAMWSSIIPAMEVFDVPFLFPNYDKLQKALNSGVGEKLSKEMEAKGAKVLLWSDYGFVQFANNKKPLKAPADFQGLKMRGYGELPSETIKALGASPVTMGGGEVYMALQRGTVDGLTSGTTAMYERKMFEVTKYLTMTNHAFPEFLVAVNLKFWKSLSAEQQKILTEAAKEVEDSLRKKAQAEDEKTLKLLQEKGMEVYVVPEADLPAWQQATAPVRELFVKRTGAVGQELIDICQKIK